ncbi:MAG: glycosyltransferase family 2 protein, partial [Bacteroidia bacterium]|nr:glycosyltransferase family 2 protein [Bacteroidia bacterium]
RTLARLKWCNEIILVDDFSTDNTVEISESFGCKVFRRNFDGFGTQKQFAVEQASNNWILNIDADEVLSDELIVEVQNTLKNPQCDGYDIPVTHVFLGKIFKHGRESKYYHLRLFNKISGTFDAALVHEKVILSGNTGKLKGVILHYSYKDLDHYFEKFNRYTSSGAQKLFQKNKKRSLFLIIASFPFYFIKHYFIYRNFMNGTAGFTWSYLNAWYHVIKYLKLKELNNKI